MFKILISGLCLLVNIQAESLTGNKVLFLQDKSINPADYSIFFNDLKERGYEVENKKASDSDLALIEYEERKYDHVILFSPKTKNFGNGVRVNDFVEFVNKGGNLVIAASSTISQAYKELGSQFHVTFDNKLTSVIDPFHQIESENLKSSPIYSSALTKLNHVVPNKVSDPVLFNGIAHKLQSNPMTFPILSAEWTAVSAESDSTSSASPSLYGDDIQLVSGFQALNNARVIISGSINLFSDEYFNTSIESKDKKSNTSNRVLAQEITKWAFQEKSVLRIDSARHALKKSDEQLDWYRVKDNITYHINLSQYTGGIWTKYQADQVQLEVVMLDPYIRTNLQHVSASKGKSSEYYAELQLPDRYGVFTFKVDYKRPGWSYLLQADVVPIRPLRHNEYPRFLSAAYPYYTGAISMSVGFLVFCLVWLYNKDPADTKQKLKTN